MECDRSNAEKRIAVNWYDSRFEAPPDRALCRFQLTNSSGLILYNIRRSILKIVSNQDQWDPLSAVSDNGRYPAVTSRAFGLEREVYQELTGTSTLLKTGDDLVFDNQIEGDREYPQLETQRAKLENLFLIDIGVKDTGDPEQIDILQLQP